MQWKIVFAALFVSLMLIFGCASQQYPSAKLPSPPSPPVLGGDKDAHGCIGTAGYSWCEQKQKCYRPWEENCTSSAPAGTACKTVSDCGAGAASCVNGTCSQYDEHGCVPDGGYSWCPEKAKCLRVWEEDCPSLTAAALEEQAKTYCGNGLTVYICGQYIRVVSDMPGAGSKFYTLGNYDPVAICPLVSPDSTSEQCRLLLFGNNCIEQKVQCGAAAPSAITDLADDPNFVGAQLTWSAPDATAVDYAIYRGDENFSEVLLIKTTGQRSYNDVFNGGNQTFAYFVRARNANGVLSPSSNIVYVQQLSTSSGPSPGQID